MYVNLISRLWTVTFYIMSSKKLMFVIKACIPSIPSNSYLKKRVKMIFYVLLFSKKYYFKY